VTMLLDLGANTESLDEAGFSALDLAALDGRHDLAQVLLERGAKVRLPAAVALHLASCTNAPSAGTMKQRSFSLTTASI
jgi:ankyrin repeat protein